MPSSKDHILQSIRQNRPAVAELPTVAYAWTRFADPHAKFVEILELVGGNVIRARNVAELNQQLSRLPQYEDATKIVSLVPGVGTSNVDLSTIDSPHGTADVDIAILPGEFAVAENAAVWVTDRHVPFRVLYFLCQHLVLVVPADQTVDHMHAAYERLTPPNGEPQDSQDGHQRNAFSEPVFGAFISGPSKTADIEQTLIIGAHGPRSLVVCLLENPP